ncbi:MAG: hypothetical protein Q4G69_12225 [Planctomycetia bacterium]|nr:hypothetical protein [Planctomycetia bacterium]
MNLFLESIWIWGVLAAFIAIAGWVIFKNTGKLLPFGLFILIAAAVLGTGFVLVFCVKTDRKEIRATILNIAGSVAKNDVPGVCEYIVPDAKKTIRKARFHMSLVELEWSKVRDFKILSINYFTSPPIAHVSFTGTVGGQVRASDYKFTTAPVHFIDVELIKDGDRWLVTDRCNFQYPGGSLTRTMGKT